MRAADIAIVFADDRFGSATNLDTLALEFASTASHEAGHTFGLRHTDNKSLQLTIYCLPASDEIMSVSGDPANQVNYNTFLRFPLSTMANEPQGDRVTTEVPYDILARNLGVDPYGPAFITGTSANDFITVSRTNSTTASVHVYAYRDSAFTSLIQTYSYSVSTTRGLFIDTNLGDDLTEIDATLGCTITVRAVARSRQR